MTAGDLKNLGGEPPRPDRPCAVIIRLAGRHAEGPDAAVHVYDTASRRDTPAQARAKVREVCEGLKTAGRPLVFKKLDSTLLGNVAAELEVVIDECGFDVALVAPAFPAMGRALVGGWLHLYGARAESARHLPTLLREQGARGVAHVGLEVVKSGGEAVAAHVALLVEQAARFITFDGETEDDLRHVARATESLGARALLAGAGALAAQVAARLPEAPARRQGGPRTSARPGRVLLVIGSTNAATEGQVGSLLRSREVVMLEPGGRLDVRTARGAHALMRLNPPCDPAELCGTIAALLRGEDAPRGLLLAGGDTAEAVARALNADAVRLVGEIIPGVVWGRVLGGAADGLPVATKAGGFGDASAIVEAVDFLAAQSATP
jgi:D-threonate/D-erythronate kinase